MPLNSYNALIPIDLSKYNIQKTSDPEIIKLALDMTKVNFLNTIFFEREIILSLEETLEVSLRNRNQALLETTLQRLIDSKKEFDIETIISIYLEPIYNGEAVKLYNILLTGLGSVASFHQYYDIKKNHQELSAQLKGCIILGSIFLSTCLASIYSMNKRLNKKNITILKTILSSPAFIVKDKAKTKKTLEFLYSYVPKEDHAFITQRLNTLC